MPARPRTWVRRMAPVVGVVAGVLVGAPSGARADAALETSSPLPLAVLDTAPTRLVLDFDEPVEQRFARVELVDQTNRTVLTAGPARDPRDPTVLAVDELPTLGPGRYAVAWDAVSADGQPVRGSFTFQVGPIASVGSEVLLEQVEAGRPQSARAVGALLGLARFVAWVGLVLLLGGLALVVATRPAMLSFPRTRALLWGGFGYLLAGTVATFALLGPSFARTGLGDALDPGRWADVAATRTGRVLLARVALVVTAGGLLGVTLARAGRRPPPSSTAGWRAGALAVAVGLVLSFSLAGHAASGSPAVVGVALGAVHLGGVVLWLGGLALLVLGGRSWLAAVDDPHGAEALAAVRRYSGWATVAVPTAVAAGVGLAWFLGGGLGQSGSTTWGRLLLVKSAVVIGVLGLGAVSRWIVRHDEVSRLRRSVAVEAALGGVVLALSAALVGAPPSAAVDTPPFAAALVADGVIVDVAITPARTGPNEVHLVLSPPGGALAPVVGATAELVRAESGDVAVVELVSSGPNHLTGSVELPESGAWELRVVIETEPDVVVPVEAQVDVAG